MEERARRHSGSPGPLEAQAFWLREPGCGEIRTVRLPSRSCGRPGPHDSLRDQPRHRVAGLFADGSRRASGRPCARPSRRVASRGRSSTATSASDVVELGPPELVGRTVFCLYPHQTAYVVPGGGGDRGAADVPVGSAVLAGLVETAVNAVWDAGPLVGDRVAVVGAGALGCCVARLLVRMPGVSVTLVDVDPARAGGRRHARGGLRATRRGTARARPGGARKRHVRGAAVFARAAGAGGHGRRAQLVRRRGDHPGSGRCVPLQAADRPRQPGRLGGPPPGGVVVRRPNGSSWPSTCCATHSSMPC